jgi:hypothetical protein
MQCLGRDTEKSQRVRLVVVWSDECGAPGAESTIGKEFYTANGEALVEAIIDKTGYLGAPIVKGEGIAHQVYLDLSRKICTVQVLSV